jgi:hypothetical protein
LPAVSYEDVVSEVVRVVEAVGGAIMVVGGIVAFVIYAQQLRAHPRDAYFRRLAPTSK